MLSTFLLWCITCMRNQDKTGNLQVLISTDVGFLNKALTIAFLPEFPEDDKACGTSPATFNFKALVSEVSHNWNLWIYCTKPTVGEMKHISCSAPNPSTFLLLPVQQRSGAKGNRQAWKRLMTDVYVGICISKVIRHQYLSSPSIMTNNSIVQ